MTDNFIYPYDDIPDGMSICSVFKNNNYDPYGVTLFDVMKYMSVKMAETGDTLFFVGLSDNIC